LVSGAVLANESKKVNMNLTVIFQVRLSKTNPAPPVLHAFNIEGESSTAMKHDYQKGVSAMKLLYPKHQDFKRLAVVQNMAHLLQVVDPDIDLIPTQGEEL